MATQIVLINGKPHYFDGEPGVLTYDEISNLAGVNPEKCPIIYSDATPMRRAFTMTSPDDIGPRENGAIYRVRTRKKCPNCGGLAIEKGIVSECEACGHSYLNSKA